MDFTVESEVEPETPAYDPSKVNPETGGILGVTVPAAADAITIPAGEPEVTGPQQGLTAAPELAEAGIGQPLPSVSGTEEAVTAAAESTGQAGFSAVWIAVIAAVAAAGGGLWFWKRKAQR